MIEGRVDHETVVAAIATATRAPSVHNTQPWRWYVGEREVRLRTDRRRWLRATDPDGRDLVLSCGTALHHLQLTLAARGVCTDVHRLPDPDDRDHLATLDLHTGEAPESDLGLVAAISRRRTDRRPFGNWPVPDAFLGELMSSAADHGAQLQVILEPGTKAILMDAVHEAAAAQDDIPGYISELTLWSGGLFPAHDGIPATNLLGRSGPHPDAQRRFAEGVATSGPPGPPDGSMLAVLGTTTDDPVSWLRAGEALSAVLLLATDLGLATCPLSQPLEIPATWRILRDGVLGDTLAPQLLLRLGWAPSGPSLPPTPRRPVAAVVRPLGPVHPYRRPVTRPAGDTGADGRNCPRRRADADAIKEAWSTT